MASVGTVTFDIAAESAKLRSEIDKVKKELGGVSSSVRAVNDTLKSAGKLVAGAFSIGAIAGFIGRVNSAADSINDLSGKLNASAANLSVIQLAAQQSGGSVEGVTTAFGAMTAKIGEAVSGNKQAIAAFDKLGLSAKQLAGMRTDQAFQAIADATSKVSNQYERASAAQDIFGKGARDIQGLLNEGTAAIDGAREALEKHGAALTDLDIARIGVMNDELGVQQTIIQNLATKTLATFSPAVSVAVDAVGQLMNTLGGTASVGREMGIIFIRAVKGIQLAATLISTAFEGVKSVVTAVLAVIAAGLKSLVGGFAWVADKLGLDVAQKLYDTRNALEQVEFKMVAMSRASESMAVTSAKAAMNAAKDWWNASDLFDQAATKMEARAAAAASTVAGAAVGSTSGTDKKKKKDTVDRTPLSVLGTGEDGMLRSVELANHAAFEAEMTRVTQENLLARVGFWQAAQMEIGALLQGGYERQVTYAQAAQMSWTQVLGGMVNATLSNNRKIAKIQQGLAIAETIWNTARNIVKALPNYPLAAKMAAVGALQLAKIKSTSYTGGSSGSSAGGFSGGGGGEDTGGSSLPSSMPANEQQQARGQAQIVINGNIFSSRETAQYLIDEISKAVTERDVVLIGKNSRQAQELMG